MSYNIEKQIIPGLPNYALTQVRYIVAHESGNPNNTGADALQGEINFMRNNWKNAFVSHWVGGGGRIVQTAPAGRMQFGAGGTANKYTYAHVELARTKSKAQFAKDYAAYIWLLRKLAKDAGLPLTLDAGTSPTSKGIKTHAWITKYVKGTTHTDPYGYLASFGISRAQFERDVEKGVAVQASAPAVKLWDVRLNDNNARVGNLQTDLKTLGYYKGKIDNNFGYGTESALKAFQKKAGLVSDGIFGPASQSAVDKAIAAQERALQAIKYSTDPKDRKGEVRLKMEMNYRTEPSIDAPIIRILPKGHECHYYEIKGDWIRLGIGWVSNKGGKYVEITKRYIPKEKPKTLYRVKVNGKQVGAYSVDDNAVKAVEDAIAKGANNIEVVKK